MKLIKYKFGKVMILMTVILKIVHGIYNQDNHNELMTTMSYAYYIVLASLVMELHYHTYLHQPQHFLD